MYFTARQLEDLHRISGANGQIVLPYRARLTPLAMDWLRSRKLRVGYSDSDAKNSDPNVKSSDDHAKSGETKRLSSGPAATNATGAFLWWCDGACGPTKAAIAMLARESSLRPIDLPPDGRQIVPVIQRLATDIKSGNAPGGILAVTHGAFAMVCANRCPSIRAVLGTCIDAVDQGIKQIAANVLVIEHPYNTLQQARNLLSRFLKPSGGLSEDLTRQLADLAKCG